VNPPLTLKRLRIIHAALVIGPLVFAAIAFFINSNGGISDQSEFPALMLYGIIGFSLLMIFQSMFMYKMFLRKIPKDAPLAKKIDEFGKASIVRFALVEGGALLSIVFYLITGVWYLLVAALVLIVFQLLNRPTFDSASMDLELNPQEKDELAKL